MKKLAALLFALLICLTALPTAQAQTIYRLGDSVEDFTVVTHDGTSLTLSQILQEKEAVLINLWATWCPPCRAEFPHMQQAYEKYQDRIEILALSVEANDTDEALAAFAQELGLTFPVGRDTANLGYRFQASAIPTSVMVDRFGRVGFIQAGALTDPESFERLFDAFLGESYTETLLLQTIPAKRPDVAPETQQALAYALGEGFTFSPDEYAYAWPMTVLEFEERSSAASTNAGQAASQAVLHADFTANAEGALAITFKTSTYPALDALTFALDGVQVKAFSGEHDWMTWAIPVSAGDHRLTIRYEKNAGVAGGMDRVLVDSLTLLTGAEAQAALAANPTHPVAEQAALTMLTPDARPVTITDPRGMIEQSFGPVSCYIVPGEALFRLDLDASIDPEIAFAFSDYEGRIVPLSSALDGDAYALSTGVDSLATTGYEYTTLQVYPDAASAPVLAALLFLDAANLDSFVTNYIPGGAWAYVEEAPAAEIPAVEVPADKAPATGPVRYAVQVLDQHGEPVPGVMVQVCNESTCQVLVTDAQGMAQIELEPYAWEIHLLKLPEGYTGDTATVVHAPVEGGEIAFAVTKE